MISLKVEYMTLKEVVKLLPKIYKSSSQQLPYAMQMYVGEEIGIRKVSAAWRKDPKNSGVFGGYTKARADRLTGKTGDSYRSFDPRNPDSLTRTFVNRKRIGATLGSRLIHLAMHETGEPSKIKPVKPAKQGRRSKTAMEAYFWHQYFEHNQEVYKRIAIKLRIHGYIDVKKRPFLAKSIMAFKTDKRYGLPFFIQKTIVEPVKMVVNAYK